MSFIIDHIHYRYQKDSPIILDNVHFTVKTGEIASIVGPSGSGKSTLVHILSGVIPNMIKSGELSGTFSIGDNTSVGVVSQSPENQLFGYGVEDAIVFGMENMALGDDEISENLEFVLNLLNIQHLRKRSVSTLSGGQRQAVCIASVLAMRPDLLIMDEPVSSLDPNGKRMVQNILNQLRAAGQTTVIVDNNLDWISDIVDHVIGIDAGNVVFDGTKEAFFHDFAMQKRLGVTIPQEVEIYRALHETFSNLSMFHTFKDAVKELESILPAKEHEPKAPKSHAPNEIILQAESLHKQFSNNIDVLKNISANFEKGRIISIIGQNGSGKTTLVKHLNGLLRPDQGRVLYRGKDTCNRTVAQISKDIILVFQHPEHMLFEESVIRELTFCARMHGVSFSEEQVNTILTEYDLIEDKDELPVNLSMGKKHLLTILSVLFSNAEIIVLDEPTLGMDLTLKTWLVNIMNHLKSTGKTVIMISHEIPLVFKMTDDILILDNGRKVFDGTKQALSEKEEMMTSINMSLPPVVQLSKHFGFDSISYTVDEFVRSVHALTEQSHQKNILSSEHNRNS